MKLNTTYKLAVLFSTALAISACNIKSGYGPKHNYEGEYRNLSDVGLVVDVNHVVGRAPHPTIEFRYARKYGEDGKKQSGGRLGMVGVSFLDKYVELLPGKYSFQLGCFAAGGHALIDYDLLITAGKTVKLSCEYVPENNFKVYIKLHSITDTDINFKRL